MLTGRCVVLFHVPSFGGTTAVLLDEQVAVAVLDMAIDTLM